MVLVDTSVWTRALANRAPYAAELDSLLGLDEVSGHESVYGELLIGDRGGRRKLLTVYEKMHQASAAQDAQRPASPATVRDTIKGYVDAFLNEWLAANPKQR